MSWLRGYKNPAESKEPEVSPRTAKRNKLQEERIQRALQRDRLKKQLKAVQEAKEEADLAEAELFALDPEIFAERPEDSDIPESEIAILLAETKSEEVVKDLVVESEESDNETIMNFDQLNEDNGDDAIKNLGHIKVNWNPSDPIFFFQKLETELQIYSVNKQFTKRQALIRCLPDDVALEFKHLVNLQETAAGNLAYKDLKTALIKAYGPRPGDAFQRAMNRVMTGKPSVLLKLITSDICKSNLVNCCCNSTVWGIFELKIPMYLKTGLANEEFNHDNMQGIMDRADNLWAANQTTTQINTVTQVAAVSSPVTQSASTQEVAAVRGRGNSRFRGRGNRGNRGRGGQSRGGQNGPDPRGKRHESNPPWNACKAHWVYADAAFQCQSPTTCPMKDKVSPKA